MSVKSTLDEEPTFYEYKAKSTPTYIDELRGELLQRMGVRMVVPDEPAVPVGDFEGVMWLGSGGYGCVIEAWDPELERAVAIKLCVNEKPRATELLMAEARILAGLQHPNIVTILEVGRYKIPDDDGPGALFLVMEFAAGGSLARRALGRKATRMPWRRLVPIFAGVARGLAAAHDAGVTHGDLKPENILIHADGRPCVADFGLSRIMGSPPLLPNAIGTTLYAAPEVLEGADPNPLSDQWSLFVALWECLEWRLPFISNRDLGARVTKLTPEGMLWLIRRWEGPSALHGKIPEVLLEVMAIGLSLDPAERFPSMHAVADALDQVMAYERMMILLESDGVLPALDVGLRPVDDDAEDPPPSVEPVGESISESTVEAAAEESVAQPVAEDPPPSVEPVGESIPESTVERAVEGNDDAAILELPTNRKGATALKGAGIALMLLVAVGGLLVELSMVKSRAPKDGSGQTTMSRPLTPAERGEQKIRAATEIITSIEVLTPRDLDVVVELWREGATLLRMSGAQSDKDLASKLTLELATQIQGREEGTTQAGALATQAAQWREAEEQWGSAAAAQELAVEIYESAVNAPELPWAQDCLANLQAQVSCERVSPQY